MNSIDLTRTFWEEVWAPPYSYDAIDELVAEDCQIFSAGTEIVGRERFKEWIKEFHSKLIDAHLAILHMFQSSDHVVTRFELNGSNGGLFELPADNRPVKMSGINIWKIEGNVLKTQWIERSGLEAFRALSSNSV